MSEHTGFTPGPWRANGNAVFGPTFGQAIATVYAGQVPTAEQGPNARLIADAPALLAERDALRKLLDKALTEALRGEGLSMWLLHEIRAALAPKG